MFSILIISFILSLFLGAVVTGNILGDMRNKSAGVVFFVWKGIQVFRKYVDTIANPKTVLQVAQRARFSQVIKIAQGLLVPVLHVYWKRFAIKKSEFNAFVHFSMQGFTGPVLKTDLQPIKGLLPTNGDIDCTDVSQLAVEMDPIGTVFVDNVIAKFMNVMWIDFATGKVAIDSNPINFTNPQTFTNPDQNMSGDYGAYFYITGTDSTDINTTTSTILCHI